MLCFLEQFLVHSSIEGKAQRFPVCSLSPHMHSLPDQQHPLQSGASVTVGEPTLTHRYYPESIVPLGFTLGVRSMVLNKCVMTGTYHCNIMQSGFTGLKILCALLMHPSLLSKLWPLIFLLYPQFCFFPLVTHIITYSWKQTVCSLFRVPSFTY